GDQAIRGLQYGADRYVRVQLVVRGDGGRQPFTGTRRLLLAPPPHGQVDRTVWHLGGGWPWRDGRRGRRRRRTLAAAADAGRYSQGQHTHERAHAPQSEG